MRPSDNELRSVMASLSYYKQRIFLFKFVSLHLHHKSHDSLHMPDLPALRIAGSGGGSSYLHSDTAPILSNVSDKS
jgi:hypothetical protein